MAIFTSPTQSGYDANPPPDDGSEGSDNQINWSTIKTKLSDPNKSYIDALITACSTSLGYVPFTPATKSADYTVTSSDWGKLFSCTNSPTITLLAAATAGSQFTIAVKNDGTGTVTVDGNGSETILFQGSAATSFTLGPGASAILTSDGTGWYVLVGHDWLVSGTVAANYTQVAPNFFRRTSAMSLSTLSAGDNNISAPSSSTHCLVSVVCYTKSANSAGNRYCEAWSLDTNGTTIIDEVQLADYEFNATPVDSVIGYVQGTLLAPVNGSGNCVVHMSADAGGYSYAKAGILAYWK